MVMERFRPGWGIIPWRPLKGLEEWERQFDDLFGRRMLRLPVEERGWMPSVDIFEKDDKFVVKAELPGMEKDNIEVNLTDHTLTIKGEKKKAEEVKEENYYRSERSYGSFMRTIELPREVHADKVKATFKNGVLEIRVPKTEEAKAKEIKVKVE